MSNVSYSAEDRGTGHCPWDLTERHCYFPRWMSVLQNSKEEALNNAFKGDDNTGENNIVQELTKEIISEVQGMTGNDVCCDCGAPGDPAAPSQPRGCGTWSWIFAVLSHVQFKAAQLSPGSLNCVQSGERVSASQSPGQAPEGRELKFINAFRELETEAHSEGEAGVTGHC